MFWRKQLVRIGKGSRTFLETVNKSTQCFATRNFAATPKIAKADRTRWNLVEPVQHLFQNGSVLHSGSSNIYANLAIEEWIYRNYDFSLKDECILLLWTNEPAVVVGRHQNVWSEVMVDYCRANSIHIARRNSGGGTVYHDKQNLNISFLTSRKCYDRTRNLTFISNVLKNRFSIESEISPRKDLVISGSGAKISGTASKLNSHNSYHHCTVLIDVDRGALRDSLRRDPTLIRSNATKSVPSPITNLRDLNEQITTDQLITELSEQFSAHFASSQSETHIIQLNHFGQIDDIHSTFTTWDWIYGKTPKFTLETSDSKLVVEKGVISECSGLFQVNDQIVQKIVGTRFEHTDIETTISRLQEIKNVENYKTIDRICLSLLSLYKNCSQ